MTSVTVSTVGSAHCTTITLMDDTSRIIALPLRSWRNVSILFWNGSGLWQNWLTLKLASIAALKPFNTSISDVSVAKCGSWWRYIIFNDFPFTSTLKCPLQDRLAVIGLTTMPVFRGNGWRSLIADRYSASTSKASNVQQERILSYRWDTRKKRIGEVHHGLGWLFVFKWSYKSGLELALSVKLALWTIKRLRDISLSLTKLRLGILFVPLKNRLQRNIAWKITWLKSRVEQLTIKH
jgi:hypothetical protein